MLSVLSVLVLVAGYIYAIACMAKTLRSIRLGEDDYEYIVPKLGLRLCEYRAVRVLVLAIAPLIYIVFGVGMLIVFVIIESPSFLRDAADDVRNAVRKSK